MVWDICMIYGVFIPGEAGRGEVIFTLETDSKWVKHHRTSLDENVLPQKPHKQFIK